MNKHQFKKWMEEDHFACFPGLKGFFDKRAQDERNAIYRKWFKMLEPFQVGYVYEASELLMKDSEGLMPQDHPSRLVAICQRLQPSVRHPFLDEEPPSEEERKGLEETCRIATQNLIEIKGDKQMLLEATEGADSSISLPSPSTDTQNDEVPLESEFEAPEPTDIKETLRQALIDLDGKADIPF